MPSAPPQKTRKASHPSVLTALGIGIVAKPGQSLKVVASDKRIRTMNERLECSSMRVQARHLADTTRDAIDLHKACRQGNLTDVEFLLEQEPSLIMCESSASEDFLGPGGTALHFAALGNHPHILAYLLKRDAVVDAESARGMTALHIACARGFVECAELLLQAGASLLKRNRQGVTPMATLNQDCGLPELRRCRQQILKRQRGHQKACIANNESILRITDRALGLSGR